LPEELQHLLFLLDQMQLAKYEPHTVNPLTIRIANAAQEKPDLSPVNELRARFQRRLEFMKKFVLTRECRQSFILRYFVEEPEGDCGICDHCLDKKQKAISADQSKKYQSMILDILQKEKEVSLRDMLSHFPGRHKQHIEQLILELVGEEKIFRKFDKLIALSRDRN
jgi:ATP-dependent DNA helicase RecQ